MLFFLQYVLLARPQALKHIIRFMIISSHFSLGDSRFLTSIYYGVAAASMLWCVAKITVLASICGVLLYYQHFPKKVIVMILGLIIGRSIIQLIIAVFIVNIILMLFVRWASDVAGKRLNAMDSESHYEQCLLIGTVLSWCTSVGVGYCFSLLSRDTAWQYVVVAAQYI